MQYSRRKFLKHTGLLTSAALVPFHFKCTNTAPGPNVVLFFSDEMDLNYLGSNGGKYPTPNLDRLASDGMKFTKAYASAAMCTPSRYGLLTGQYPGRCTHPVFLEDFPAEQPYSIGWNSYVHSSVATLPMMLSQNGYITGMTGKWHISPPGLEDDAFLADVDPDTEINTPELNEKLAAHQKRIQDIVAGEGGFDLARSVIYTNNDDFKVKKLRYHNFPWVTKGAVDLLDEFNAQHKPFFLYVAGTACHGPHHGESLEFDMRNTQEGRVDEVSQFQPDTEEIKSAIKDLSIFEAYKYAGMAELDHQAGVIMQKLKDLGMEENTIFIFMSDHNVEPGKASCYEQGLRVPAIVKWPAMIHAGSSSDALMQNIDVMPTILDIAGISKPEGHTFDGVSFYPVIRNKTQQVRQNIFAESGYARSVMNGKYKYIAFRPPQDVISQMENGETEFAPNFMNVFKQAHAQISIQYYPGYFDQDQLYDLESDPYEQNNLAGDHNYAGVLDEMKSVLGDHLKTIDHPFDLEKIPFMETAAYRKLAENTKNLGTDFIPWWQGRKINFPPV